MTTFTITAAEVESARAARLQLIDLGDEKTAATLAWALTAEPTASRDGWTVGDMTPDVAEILGRPNFRCARIAHLLSATGDPIETRSEAEQSAVLRYLLKFYVEHGSEWDKAAEADIKRRIALLPDESAGES